MEIIKLESRKIYEVQKAWKKNFGHLMHSEQQMNKMLHTLKREGIPSLFTQSHKKTFINMTKFVLLSMNFFFHFGIILKPIEILFSRQKTKTKF